MSRPYNLITGDCAGPRIDESFATFAELVAHAEKNKRLSGDLRVAFNTDRCDYDTNGLTEDEEEALEVVL